MSVFYRLGLFCARRRWLVIGVWAVALLVVVPFAPQVPARCARAASRSMTSRRRAPGRLLEDELHVRQSAMVIVLQSTTDARAGDPAFEAAVAQAIADVPHGRARRRR